MPKTRNNFTGGNSMLQFIDATRTGQQRQMTKEVRAAFIISLLGNPTMANRTYRFNR